MAAKRVTSGNGSPDKKPGATRAGTKTAKPKKPAGLDADQQSRLLAVLASLRPLGGASYPPTLARLAVLADLALGPVAIASLSGIGLIPEKPKKTELATSHVYLSVDGEAIVAGALARLLLAAAKGPLSLAALVKKAPKPLQATAGARWKALLEAGTAPDGVGAVADKKSFLLFPLDRLLAPHPAPAPEETAGAPEPEALPVAVPGRETPAPDHAAAFDARFEALDRAGGGRNQVTLAALREGLAELDRAAFDELLHRLRRERRYALEAHDGRQARLPDEVLAAGIREDGRVLAYVMRRG